jgi:hypothetical protein
LFGEAGPQAKDGKAAQTLPNLSRQGQSERKNKGRGLPAVGFNPSQKRRAPGFVSAGAVIAKKIWHEKSRVGV